jgi:hypothetical protein
VNLNPLQIVVIVAALAFLGFVAIITRDLRRKY